MPTSFNIKLGSYTFDLTPEDWQEILDQTLNVKNVVNKHGGSIPSVTYARERQIRIKGSLNSDSISGITTLIDNLRSAVNKEGFQNLYLWDDRFIKVQKSQYADRPRPGSAGLVWDYEITFTATDPTWQSDTLNDSGDTSPTTSPETILTLTNNGTAPAPVIITVSANTTSNITDTVKITNLSDDPDQVLEYSGDIAASESVIIDEEQPETERVLNDGDDDVKSLAGQFIRLLPGSNSIQFEGDITATINIKWRDRWF